MVWNRRLHKRRSMDLFQVSVNVFKISQMSLEHPANQKRLQCLILMLILFVKSEVLCKMLSIVQFVYMKCIKKYIQLKII